MNKYYAASHLLVGKHKVHKHLSYKMIAKQTQAFWKLHPLVGMMGTLDSWEKKQTTNESLFYNRNELCSCVYYLATYYYAQSLSCIQLFATSRTVVHQVPLSMEFSKQEYWSGLPFPTPGDLSNPGIEPMSPASPALAGRFITSCATWEAQLIGALQSGQIFPVILAAFCPKYG